MKEIEDNDTQFDEDLLVILLKHNRVNKQKVIEWLMEEGELNKDSARDYLIRKTYVELQEKENMSAKEAREWLAEHFHTGLKNIERILYMK